MTRIIDRRLNGKNKSAVNRQRFIRRFRGQIKQAVNDAIKKRSITDIDKGEKINIPAKDISEPGFYYDNGGVREEIHPGNKEFITGDKIQRPPKSQGGDGGKASNTGEGVDDFIFELSREEFLEFFFDDLALPDLVKTKLTQVNLPKYKRAGYTTTGVPNNINVVRTLKLAMSRRIALGRSYVNRLRDTQAQLTDLDAADTDERPSLELEAEELTRKIKRIPFIDEFDLRYNHRIPQPAPSAQAVMFCIMDVSGSMDRERKDIAKRFFALLYLFLTRNYKTIDLVFIRHHTTAKEVSEDDFFYSRETGGTVVSSALELSLKIIQERYPTSDWNIYIAQASDGDNWHGDSPLCREILENRLMSYLQYYAYVEIGTETHQRLWQEYTKVASSHSNFAMRQIDSIETIFPVFHELFKKQSA